MKKRAAWLLITLIAAGCASQSEKGLHGLPERTFEFPDTSQGCAKPSLVDIESDTLELRPFISRYPPILESEAHRDYLYARWSGLVICAQALRENHEAERQFFVLSELYWQGHNLDVLGAAQRAEETLQSCLDEFPESELCNLSASWFYLSIRPTQERLDIAERSLRVLQRNALPGYSEDAEAGLVFLRIYQRDPQSARDQIRHYLALFPDSTRAADFRKIRDEMGDEIRFHER